MHTQTEKSGWIPGLTFLAILVILAGASGIGACGHAGATKDVLPPKAEVDSLLAKHGYAPHALLASVPATVAGTTYLQFNYTLESSALGGGGAILVLCDAETPENVQGLMAMRARRESAEDVRARDANLQTFAGIVSELTGVQGILGETYRTGELLPMRSGPITLPGWSAVAGDWEVIVMTADPEHEDPQVMFFIIREREDQAGS